MTAPSRNNMAWVKEALDLAEWTSLLENGIRLMLTNWHVSAPDPGSD